MIYLDIRPVSTYDSPLLSVHSFDAQYKSEIITCISGSLKILAWGAQMQCRFVSREDENLLDEVAVWLTPL